MVAEYYVMVNFTYTRSVFKQVFGYTTLVLRGRPTSHQPIDDLQNHEADKLAYCVSGERRAIKLCFEIVLHLEFKGDDENLEIEDEKWWKKPDECGVLGR